MKVSGHAALGEAPGRVCKPVMLRHMPGRQLGPFSAVADAYTGSSAMSFCSSWISCSQSDVAPVSAAAAVAEGTGDDNAATDGVGGAPAPLPAQPRAMRSSGDALRWAERWVAWGVWRGAAPHAAMGCNLWDDCEARCCTRQHREIRATPRQGRSSMAFRVLVLAGGAAGAARPAASSMLR